jgi:acetoin utilization deacetylase AcuC-like enzyme
MIERIIFHTPEQSKHGGWIDSEGKPWDTPDRMFGIVSDLINNSTSSEWVVVSEVHPEVLDLIEKVHSTDMIRALSDADVQAINQDSPVTTVFDKNPDDFSSALYPGSFDQALISAECAMLAADSLIDNKNKTIIALTRPPGHHAGKNFYHGFCYINNAAVAAEELRSVSSKIAILDIDAHHGDGTQDIFYDDPSVLYASLHASPDEVFPHSGYQHETGFAQADGMTLNLPFLIGINEEEYLVLFQQALEKIHSFRSDYIIISAGFDAHKDEFEDTPPITQLDNNSYRKIGELIAELNIPCLVLLEGGYNQDVLPSAFSSFISGIENAKSKPIEVFTSDEVLINEKEDI